MYSLFFYGTLCHAPLLRLILGREVRVRPAVLHDHAVYWARNQKFPVLVVETGGRAAGIIVADLLDADIAKLDFYEGAFDYALTEVSVHADAGPVATMVYMPPADVWPKGAVWVLQDWVDDLAEVTLKASVEVMRGFGFVAADVMAQRRGIIWARAQSQLRTSKRMRPEVVSAPMRREDVTVERLARPYEKFFTVEEYDFRFRRFNDAQSAHTNRAVFQVGDAVTVLPYDPVRDRVLLVEQFRIGAYAHDDPQPWLLEPIAGIVDAGEQNEDAARREALEEAHLVLGALHFVAEYYPSPGGISQILYSYIGIAELPDEAASVAGLEAEQEDIRGIIISFEQLMMLLASGEACNASLIISAQWLAANRARLRS
jgi:ADP-ribose pyrophosphatase